MRKLAGDVMAGEGDGEGRLNWQALAHDSYRLVFAERDSLLRLAWPAALCFVVAELFAFGMDPTDPESLGIGRGMAGLVAGLLGFVVFLPALAVAWFRMFLSGEDVPGAMPPINARSFKMAGYSILIALMIALAIMIAAAVALPILGVIGALLLGMPLAALVASRLGLALPSIAIDEQPIGFGEAWALSRGESAALIMALLAVSLPVGLVALILGATGLLSLVTLGTLLEVVQVILSLTMLGLAYRALRDRNVPSLPEAP